MRLGRLLIIVSILVILGLVAIYALLNLNPNGGIAEDPSNPSGNTTDVVVVQQNIPRGGRITADALGYISLPTEQTIGTMLTDISAADGRIARYDLEPGQFLMASMVVDSADQVAQGGSDTSLAIPSGMVAFPIPIDRFSSLAYGLRAGDHVNVIATMLLVDMDTNSQSRLPNNVGAVVGPGGLLVTGSESAEGTSTSVTIDPLINTLTAQVVSGGAGSPLGQGINDEATGQPFYVIPSESQRPRLVSQTLLQDITILHVGNFLYTDENGDEVTNAYGQVIANPDGTTTTIKPAPDLITLIVTPQDAVTLNYLVYAGAELTMALRSATDSSFITTEAVTLEYLLNTYNIPVPTKLPFGLEPRIDSLLSPTRQDALPAPQQ
jgi:Flp pilus assembly protein CpaB